MAVRALLPIYFAAVALAAAALLLAETERYGVGVSPDSVLYIAQARELATPGRAAAALGRGFVSQPPGYPLALAAVSRAAHVDPSAAARALNAVLFGFCVFASCLLLARGSVARLHPLLAVTAPLFVVTSRSLHEVFAMAWSEPLFVALTVAFLACLCRHLLRGGVVSLVAAGAFAAGAAMTRYSGVSIVAAGVLSLLLVPGRGAGRWRAALGFGAGAAAPVVAWAARNLHAAGTAFGARDAAVLGPADNLLLSLRVLQAHFLPASDALPVAAKGVIAAAVAGLVLAIAAARAAELRAALARERALLVPCALLGLVGLGFTIATSSVVAYDPINLRLLAPLYVPFFLMAALAANAVLSLPPAPGRRLPAAPWIVAVLLVLAVVQPSRQFAQDFGRRRAHGEGLGGAAWSDSELLAAVAAWPGRTSATPLFSNVPAALAWHLGIDARNAPRRTPCAALTGAAARACFDAHVDPRFRAAHFVYFSTQAYPYYYGLEELSRFVALTPVVSAADGGVYRVGPLPAP